MSETTVGRVEFGPLYADRDPRKLEPQFSQHMHAMTAENLHSKAAIAEELAHRDREIERLTAENSALWELSDTAVLASLKLNKKVGAELIRLRTNLGLSRVSGRQEQSGV